MNKKEFENLLMNNLDVIRKDFKEKTNISLDSLSIKQIGDTSCNNCYNKQSYIISNYLDDKLGVLSNMLKKLHVSMSISFVENNTLILCSSLKYTHRNMGTNSLEILSVNQSYSSLSYLIQNDKLVLIPTIEGKENYYRLILSYSDSQLDDIVLIGVISNTSRISTCLRDVENLKTIRCECFKSNKWIEVDMPESFNEIIESELHISMFF